MVIRILVVLLIVVPLAGGVNYARNEPLDADLKNRTYATVTDADLSALLEAYGAHATSASQGLEGGPGSDGVERYGASDLGGKAKGFAKFQERNREWRDARGKVQETKATIAEIHREQALRARGLHTEFGRILRRVKTL